MENNFKTALDLLIVGMPTVFLILFLVVFIGNMIIRFVNRYVPQESEVAVVSKPVEKSIEPQKMAAIVSAVQLLTKGKGRVVKVEKK